LMVAAAFLLGCQEVSDSDVWWHVRSGQWIWSHRSLPVLDPFTFASADRPWIDLHWLFQLVLAGSYALGGVPGMILLASAAWACMILVGLTSRERQWPMWMIVPCWLPALVVLSDRFAPRPELLSLLAMAVYLAVLRQADRSPALAWVLPLVQVFWVNAHALFILGPVILGAYLIDRLARPIGRSRSAFGGGAKQRWWWWIHVGGAALAVGLACLANPYGLRGALFPLELLPKISSSTDNYKLYIIEFMDLRKFVRQRGITATGSQYFRAECFLLWALPLSFIVPAVWREAALADRQAAGVHAGRALVGLGGFGLAIVLILASVLSFPGQGTSPHMIELGQLAPIGLVSLGGLVAVVLRKASREVRLLAAVSGVAVASWIVWLRAYLLGSEQGLTAWLGMPASGSFVVGVGTAILGAVTAGLTWRAGARPFGMMLVALFGFLGIRAIRNLSLFGLAAGFVLAWNVGEWAAELAAQVSARWPRRAAVAGLAARTAVAGVIVLMISSVVSGQFYLGLRVRRTFGLGESPSFYAHDAARFAGQPGLPERALVFGLRQAGVFLFHNGPERKPFMDGRLEVPTRETFATYVQVEKMLNQGRRGWAEPLRRMGDPLVLLEHENEYGAEATLILDTGWRCVYYDAVASVFVPRGRRELDASHRSVDFAARHFQVAGWRAEPSLPKVLAEGRALLNLGSTVRVRSGVLRPRHFRLMLAAFDRFRQAVAVEPAVASHWSALGTSCWNMPPDPSAPLLRPDEPWDLARGLLPAQATFCYRRALELDPGDISTLSALSLALEARAMNDARRTVASLLERAQAAAGATDTDRARTLDGATLDMSIDQVGPRKAPMPDDDAREPLPSWEGRDGLDRAITALLARGRPEAAVRAFASAENQGVTPSWTTCDRVAAALLHLGRPAEAHRVWERAADPPSRAIQLTRLATNALAALDLPAAERMYRAALLLDGGLGEAWCGLAALYMERGDARTCVEVARAALRLPTTPAQRAFMADVVALAAPYAAYANTDPTR
jgi:tetratricopeptide (TPR) repeat protein